MIMDEHQWQSFVQNKATVANNLKMKKHTRHKQMAQLMHDKLIVSRRS